MESATHERVRALLMQAFNPTALDIVDDSAAHGRHAAMRGRNASHLIVTIVSTAFAGKTRIARHQMINAALRELFASGALHACAMTALTPDEALAKK